MIAAFDSSINRTGYCILSDAGEVIASGVIRTRGESTLEKQTDLRAVVKNILGAKMVHIKAAVVEVPAPHAYNRTTGRGGKIQNLDALLKLSRAVAIITQTLHDWGVPVHEVTPQQWKANRQKCWDRLWVEQKLGRKVTDDESDAVALCYYWHMFQRGKR